MTWIRFPQVTMRGIKRGKCSRCGKTHERRRIFEMTINPYNTNAAGEMKSEHEVRDDLRLVVEKWKREPIEPCRPRA